jgi:hypothetical protein
MLSRHRYQISKPAAAQRKGKTIHDSHLQMVKRQDLTDVFVPFSLDSGRGWESGIGARADHQSRSNEPSPPPRPPPGTDL